ncbi:hypothetical protein [Dolichospermum circinale]|uniref:hypothetical protein n=1 Tax=Dolichospermum circinale TaxID=109265 RepID=UPI001E4A6763|nr:hypothetical protein [Dolichospermum circinale]MDB9453497.1 hypothetical protein [Dolichospermum circinale CS-541/06]MDB9462610.1 hypothetical protein [Dolichospermum circinale CS-541/04]MDB9475548.1 hypothetical protein [Dolichospermum circinale CS-537/11]MDB9477613.1 hypothetical protein [Dolichospermum circinale CS-537/03]
MENVISFFIPLLNMQTNPLKQLQVNLSVTAATIALLVTAPSIAHGQNNTTTKPASSTPKTSVVNTSITEAEVLAAQKAWGQALVSISTTYDEKGMAAAKKLADDIIDTLYAYQSGLVLFKPTLTTGDQTFRTTHKGALSYFVGGDSSFPQDTGFALKGWRKVEIRNAGIFIVGNTATTMGNVSITDKTGKVTTVDKTWQFIRGGDGKLRIILHHSSLPYSPK